jgi:hypothetical protein
VSELVVLVEKQIVVLPLARTFAPNVVPQPLQNLTVKLAIDGLTRGYDFLLDNFLDVEKKISMDLTRFFFSATVNLATSTAKTAASSQGHNHTPKYHPWL